MGLERRAAWRDVPVLVFAMLFPLALTWVYFVVLADDSGAASPLVVAAYGAGKFVMLLLPIVYVACVEPGALRPAPPHRRGLGLGLGFGLLVAAATLALYHLWLEGHPWAAATPGLVYQKVRQFDLTDARSFLIFALLLSVLHSLFEEYYWRWFVFGRLRRYLPLAAAIALSSIGFALHHVVILYVYFPGSFWVLALPFSIAVAVGGAVWAWLYDWSGSLYAPWLSHLVVDAALMAVGRAMLTPYWT
jgi:membrane protease YdiL (CAAX protease family)